MTRLRLIGDQGLKLIDHAFSLKASAYWHGGTKTGIKKQQFAVVLRDFFTQPSFKIDRGTGNFTTNCLVFRQ